VLFLAFFQPRLFMVMALPLMRGLFYNAVAPS